MAAMDQRKLGQILIDQGMITLAQLEDALSEQRVTGRFFGEVLVGRGVSSEEQIARALSEQLGFAFVDVSEMNVEPKALELVPRDMCEKNILIPVFISQNTLTVAMANALDVQVIDKIQASSHLRVRPVFACPSAIRGALQKEYHSESNEPADAALPASRMIDADSAMGKGAGVFVDQVSSLKQAANLKPVVERVDQIISKAVELGASDIHLEPEKNKFNCRYRIDGILHSLSPIPAEEQAAVISRIKIMAEMDIAEKRLPQDGRVRTFTMGRDVDLRVSTFPTLYGENVVIRILDRSGGLLKLTDLGFSKHNLEAFSRLIRRPYGIILVTGPTGSGKTTALYAALTEINTTQKNIITLEDPVEYEIGNVRQSQINVKAGLSFANGLRSIVRQDPDIIMIGEIRDRETAEIAIHAALTGHLVLSTLHTNDAPSAAARLIDMGVEPFLVSTSIIAILAQRLIRTLCPACKQKYEPDEALLKQLDLDPAAHAKTVFYREAGCPRCKQYGYQGRTGIYELLMPSEFVKELIAKKVSAPVIAEAARKTGMITLREAGIEKVVEGVTSVSEVLRVTEEM